LQFLSDNNNNNDYNNEHSCMAQNKSLSVLRLQSLWHGLTFFFPMIIPNKIDCIVFTSRCFREIVKVGVNKCRSELQRQSARSSRRRIARARLSLLIVNLL